jgi:hypothetical protein
MFGPAAATAAARSCRFDRLDDRAGLVAGDFLPLGKAPFAEQVGADLGEGRRGGGDDRFHRIDREFLILDQRRDMAFAFAGGLESLRDQRGKLGRRGEGGLRRATRPLGRIAGVSTSWSLRSAAISSTDAPPFTAS